MRNEGGVDHELDADMRHSSRRPLADAQLKETLSDESLPLNELGCFMEDGVGLVVKSYSSRHPRFDLVDREACHRG